MLLVCSSAPNSVILRSFSNKIAELHRLWCRPALDLLPCHCGGLALSLRVLGLVCHKFLSRYFLPAFCLADMNPAVLTIRQWFAHHYARRDVGYCRIRVSGNSFAHLYKPEHVALYPFFFIKLKTQTSILDIAVELGQRAVGHHAKVFHVEGHECITIALVRAFVLKTIFHCLLHFPVQLLHIFKLMPQFDLFLRPPVVIVARPLPDSLNSFLVLEYIVTYSSR